MVEVVLSGETVMALAFIAGMWSQEPARRVLHATVDLVTGLKSKAADNDA